MLWAEELYVHFNSYLDKILNYDFVQEFNSWIVEKTLIFLLIRVGSPSILMSANIAAMAASLASLLVFLRSV